MDFVMNRNLIFVTNLISKLRVISKCRLGSEVYVMDVKRQSKFQNILIVIILYLLHKTYKFYYGHIAH